MWLDGSPVEPEDLAALALYNYGHFTSMRVEKMRVRGLGLHLDRLVEDSRILYGQPVDPKRVRQLVRQALADGPSVAVVRVTVFAPDLDLAHPGEGGQPRVLVTTRPAPDVRPGPMRVKSVQYHRDLPGVKHVGLFAQIAHRRTAQLDGFDDALFVDANKVIAEGATWNIGFLQAGEVVWPDARYLIGVTMRLLQDNLKAYDMEMKTLEMRLDTLTAVDSAFATNAAIGVRPISAIDNHHFIVDVRAMDTLRQAYLATVPESL